MSKVFTKTPVAMLLAASLLVPCLGISVSAHGEGESAKTADAPAKSRVRRTPALRPVVYTRLEEVQKLADQKNYAAALERLAALQKMQRNSYEQAMTWSMQAYVYFNQENYAQATRAYEEVLKIQNIPLSMEESSQFSLAKLYFVQQQYAQALQALNAWFDITAKPNSQAYMMRAQMQYEMKNYQAALPDVKMAMQLAREQAMKIPETWLLLERAVYYQNKDFRSMERCLQDLIALYPKKQYWLQLAAVYNEMNMPLKEVAIMEMLYEQGELQSEAEQMNLAQAMLASNMPYKAANVLLQGLKKGSVSESVKVLGLLGDAFMLAKEYEQAITMMGKTAQASGLARDYLKLAQVTADRQRWDEALSAVDKALAAGGLSDVHNAYVLKGMILFNMDKLALAQAEFERARAYPQSQAAATQWLGYIESEQQRRAYMAAAE